MISNVVLDELFQGDLVTSYEDMIAISIAKQYAINSLDKSDKDYKKYVSELEVYVVWKCKVLQNWKYLISTSLPDGMYYELTYNGDKDEWYFDAYKKIVNECICQNRAIGMLNGTTDKISIKKHKKFLVQKNVLRAFKLGLSVQN